MIKAFIFGYGVGGPNASLIGYIKDSNDTHTYSISVEKIVVDSDTSDDFYDEAEGLLNQYCIDNSIPEPDEIYWLTPKRIDAGAHIADGSNNAATNAATNAPTNLNPVTTLLGSLTGEVNATNAKQNDLAAKYNDLATKYNDLATKFNTYLDRGENAGILLTS